MSMIGHYIRITPRELAAIEAAPETVADFVYRQNAPDAGERHLDIDKAWHAIHFLLNYNLDAADELFNVVLGGEALGDADLGTGPARVLTASEVAGMATALRSVSVGDLRARWDPQELEERRVYPRIWDEGDVALDYVLENYQRLVQFFAAAAREGDALITYIA